MRYDVIVVGGGLAGLTASAYLSRSGFRVLLCEKEPETGGLVNSFHFKGFTFDGGIRAFENSGILLPMLRQLGIALELVHNPVSIGIGDDIVQVESERSLADYRALLVRHFPENSDDIDHIVREIARIMGYMDVLYGIDNPLFLDLKADPTYVRKTLLPWLVRYLGTMGKVAKMDAPVEEQLRRSTSNRRLIDVIAQHFFKKTPAFFALSYFSLYLGYLYPVGGTGVLSRKMTAHVREHGGEIRTGTRIVAVDPQRRQVRTEAGEVLEYGQLVWAADLKTFYKVLDIDALRGRRLRKAVASRQAAVVDKVGGDSILTLYLTVDRDPSEFARTHSAHFFFTPNTQGISELGPYPIDWESLLPWLGRYLERTTYEISLPVLRDATLAPAGKTGLIVSTLMDHALVRAVSDAGWYGEFKDFCEARIASVLDGTVYPGLESHIMERFLSTPLTLEKRTGNADGAITGWAFTNPSMPAERRMPRIARSVLTPVPDVLQAGQWTFSPSGLPIAILTGKLAADEAAKRLRRRTGRE